MADVFDNFARPAAFGDIAFPFIQLSIKGSLDHKVHKYLHRPGGEVEDLARRAYEFRFECQFDSESRAWPDLYPDRLGQLVALCESGQTFALYVPNLASEVQAKATDWPRTLHASVRSGERVEFAFVEDSTDQYTTNNIISFAAGTAPAQFDALSARVNEVEDEEALSLLDKVRSEVDKWRTTVESAQLVAEYQFAQMDALLGACEAMARAPALQLAQNSLVLRAAISLWSTVAKARTAALTSSRPLAAWVTDRDALTVVDVSLKLYGTPANSLELMSLNELDDALNIRLGTSIRYRAAA